MNHNNENLWDFNYKEDSVKMDSVSPLLYKSWIFVLKQEIKFILTNYKLNFPIPNVIVDDSIKCWGKWDSLTKTIYISKRLLLCYSWNSVTEILKHEIAHMIVSDVYKGADTGPHGERFKDICRRLAVSPRASASDAEIGLAPDDRNTFQSQKNPYFEKIKKLLALSESMNENEASQAMQKANELLLKYNLSLQNIFSLYDEYNYKYLGQPKTKISFLEAGICNLLKDFFFIEYIIVPVYDPFTNSKLSAIEILGKNENIEMAEYVFYFLIKQTELMWLNHKKQFFLKGITEKKSYLLGLLEGIRHSLTPNTEILINNKTSKELIELNQNHLFQFLKYRYPRIRMAKRNGSVINPLTYKNGTLDGKKVRIFTPLNKNNINEKLFLTGK